MSNSTDKPDPQRYERGEAEKNSHDAEIILGDLHQIPDDNFYRQIIV
jgi:hypothetical protein